MDSPCIEQTVCKVLKIFQYRKYLVAYVLKIKCEQNISFPEARKQYEQFYDTRSYASAVKPCNKSTQTENKTTQTDDSFDEYLKKKQEKSPSEKTPKETPKGKQDKNTSSPRPGPALKPATLEMMKKEEKKKKEEKDRIKQQQKEERRKQYHKDKQEKELREKEEAEKAQQNPYSVLHKDDTEVYMEEESVVFTESASSDHLPKGTLPRLPVTQ